MESERESEVGDDVDWGLISEEKGVAMTGEFGDEDQDEDMFRMDACLSILDSETDDIDAEFVEAMREIKMERSRSLVPSALRCV